MNMRYCMFQNTAKDFRDCLEVITEASDNTELDLSDSEMQAAERLYSMAQEYVELFNSL